MLQDQKVINEHRYFADIRWKSKDKADSTDYINFNVAHKNLGKFNLLLPPNCNFINNGKFVSINRIRENRRHKSAKLKNLLLNSIKKRAYADCVLVSGGLDSSFLVKSMLDLKRKPIFVSCGFPDSEDIKAVGYLEKSLKINVEKIIITKKSLLNALKALKKSGLDEYNCMLGVVEFLSAEAAKRAGSKNIMSGVGSDELFLGFERHRKIGPEDINDFVKGRMYYMHAYDILRLNRISQIQKLDVSLPYLDRELIDFAFRHCNADEFERALEKGALRKVAKEIALPEKIIARKKRAMQYGSGVIEAMRDMASKKKFKNVGELIKYI